MHVVDNSLVLGLEVISVVRGGVVVDRMKGLFMIPFVCVVAVWNSGSK